MLSNNNHLTCAFGEQIVSYIYDEASAKEKNEFESHLPNCLSCADEIAGFGLVRSSINEWRKDEFFTLESPALKIPSTLVQPTVTSEKDSWIDELRKLFTFSPAWTAGFAALIICIGLVWMFFGNSKNNDMANVPPVAPIIETKEVSMPKEENASVNPQEEKVKDAPKQIIEIEKTVNPQPKQVVKVSNVAPKLKSTPKSNNTMATNKTNLNRTNKSNNVQKQEAPTLSGIDAEEDKSLRLSELFAEVDSK